MIAEGRGTTGSLPFKSSQAMWMCTLVGKVVVGVRGERERSSARPSKSLAGTATGTAGDSTTPLVVHRPLGVSPAE